MLEPLSNQEEKDRQQLVLLNEDCTTENLRIPIRNVKILNHRTGEVLESIHVGLDYGMYAVAHELYKSYGRCLVSIWYFNGNIEIRTLKAGEELHPARTK